MVCWYKNNLIDSKAMIDYRLGLSALRKIRDIGHSGKGCAMASTFVDLSDLVLVDESGEKSLRILLMKWIA